MNDRLQLGEVTCEGVDEEDSEKFVVIKAAHFDDAIVEIQNIA